MANHPLTEYHDAEDPLVFRWNERVAAVQLSRWCVTLVPHDGAKLDDPGSRFRDGLTQLLESEASMRKTISFGELSMWANRRIRTDVLGDPQTVLDAIYNRQVIRESLQWLYQHRVAGDADVYMRTVFTEAGRANGKRCPGRALIMRCNDWTAVVMNCIADAGDDPLFGEAHS